MTSVGSTGWVRRALAWIDRQWWAWQESGGDGVDYPEYGVDEVR